MKIIADENLAFAEQAFSQFGKVELYPGRKITSPIVKDADALIVRSITEVNEALLKNSNVKFVGTATIGFDHIDVEYLKNKKVFFSTAAGCNSYAVAEYVLTILFNFAAKNNFSISNKSIGIIGCGNIGSKVARYAKALGMKVFINDPPLEKTGSIENFSSLEETLGADFITFHVPLNPEGEYKSFHLLNEENINLIKSNAVLINSSRGPVVDNQALLNRMNNKNDIFTVLDVWENEPDLNIDLLKKTTLATPHIAGYTLEGKVNGTVLVYKALCEFLNVEEKWIAGYPEIENSKFEMIDKLNFEKSLFNILNNIYSIEDDSAQLKSYNPVGAETIGKYFDSLRKNYKLRREFNNYTIKVENADLKKVLETLRFNITK